MKAPLPPNEVERLEALRRYDILDTEAEQDFDDITLLASQICGTPIALISLIDEERQWFKSKVGMTENHTSRDIAFCAHGIHQSDLFEVPDALDDKRFADNPLVQGSVKIRFYMGSPLVTPDGHALGMLCVKDQVPRDLSAQQKAALTALSRQVIASMELRRQLTERRVAAEALRESNEARERQQAELRVLFDLMPAMVWFKDRNNTILRLNQRAADLVGRSIEEIEGRSVAEVRPERAERSHEDDLEVVRSGKPKLGVIEMVPAANGEERWLQIDRVPHFDREGKVIGVVIMAQDITERRRAEEALRESQRFAESIAANSTSNIYTYDLETSRHLYSNRDVGESLGYSREQILAAGEGFIWSLIYPDDLPRIAEHTAAFVHIADGEIVDFEYRLRHANGEWRWLWARETVFKRRPNGAPWQIMGTSQDITERKRAEDQLRHTASIVASSHDAILSKTLDGTILSWNPAAEALYGYTAEETIGKNVLMLLPPDRASEEAEIIRRIKAEEFIDQYESVRMRKDGGLLHVSLTISAVKDSRGQIIGASKIARDITERHRKDAELRSATAAAESASRAKSEFLANMSHEIRTPMNGILGMTELVLETELTDKQREYLGMAKSSAISLLGLINNILDFSKIEAGKLDLEAIPFGLREFVHHMLKPLALRGQQKGLEVCIEIAEPVHEQLIGDPLRLRQIVTNFVDNALKFTDHGSVVVKVSLEDEKPGEQCLHFCVTDTGIGIPADKREAIFEAFAQVDGSTTRHYGGTGLGLAIVSRLVAQMRGRIWIDSTLGEGTTFHFTAWFSLGQASRQPENSFSSRASAGGTLSPSAKIPAAGGLHILLAEDNVINHAVARGILERQGHTLVHARDGREAVEACESAVFDLILMDIQMPEMDGFEATARIRDREKASVRKTPIIAMTAHAMTGDRERCLAGGMDDYVAKPLQKEKLFAVLARFGKSASDMQHADQDSRVAPLSTISTREELLDRVDDDEELLQTLLVLFHENTPRLIDEIAAAIDSNDGRALASAAHALLSSLGAFGAQEAIAIARKLEQLGERNDCASASRPLADLRQAIEQINIAMTAYEAAVV